MHASMPVPFKTNFLLECNIHAESGLRFAGLGESSQNEPSFNHHPSQEKPYVTQLAWLSQWLSVDL